MDRTTGDLFDPKSARTTRARVHGNTPVEVSNKLILILHHPDATTLRPEGLEGDPVLMLASGQQNPKGAGPIRYQLIKQSRDPRPYLV